MITKQPKRRRKPLGTDANSLIATAAAAGLGAAIANSLSGPQGKAAAGFLGVSDEKPPPSNRLARMQEAASHFAECASEMDPDLLGEPTAQQLRAALDAYAVLQERVTETLPPLLQRVHRSQQQLSGALERSPEMQRLVALHALADDEK